MVMNRHDIALMIAGAVLHGSGARAQITLTWPSSREADVCRASQVPHAVEDLDRHVHFGGPALVRARAQPVPDHAFISADRGLGPGSLRVSGGLLPCPAAPLGDDLQ